jgi:DNA-binding XRE family transcriptional regulator
MVLGHFHLQERNTMPSRNRTPAPGRISTPSKRFADTSLTPEERRKVRRRATQFKAFRADYLYTQKALAGALHCSVRTVASVESGCEVVRPSLDLLRRFRDLKRREIAVQREWETRVA